jgi:hypothetical protein
MIEHSEEQTHISEILYLIAMLLPCEDPLVEIGPV